MIKLPLSLIILISIVSNNTFKAQNDYLERLQQAKYGTSTQNYSTISYTELNIIYLSVKVSYSGSNYAPSNFSYNTALNTMQARYDYYYKMINNEWGKLEEFDLINSNNKTTLNNHKIAIRNYFKNNNSFTHVDWARNGDFALKIVKYIGNIYNNTDIKSEISLLKAINNEYYRLKKSDPDNFHKSTRYGELMTVLGKLKYCSTSEIGTLSANYGLW
jgi:hypothetical protein